MIAGDDRIGFAGEGAFENSVVGLVLEYAKPPPRVDHGTQSGKEQGGARQLLNIAGELACEDIKQFVEDRFGQQSRSRSSTMRCSADSLPAGKDEPGEKDVGIENDLQEPR